MNYLSLYRKYRPHTFKDVVGQEHIVKILKNSIKNNCVANAYVFAGTKGTGKTSIAKIYANAINCLDNVDGDICGKCEICHDFANNQVMDVVELDAASNNGVEDIRRITDAVYALPAKLNKKVYIIDEAHMLTTQAWNALLKTVEEPPKHVVFIFATTEMHKIPSTILSRCQCFTFSKISHSDIVKLLTKVCDKEGYKYNIEALKAIADIVDGSARDSLSFLEQVATFGNNEIKLEDIYQVYGILSAKDAIDFLNIISANNSDRVFSIANKYFASGVNFVNFANLIVSVLTDKLIFLKTKNYKLLTKTNEVLINSLAINDINKLMKLLDIWQETYFKVSTPTDVHVIIDYAILRSISIFDSAYVETNEFQPVLNAATTKPTPTVTVTQQPSKPAITLEDFEFVYPEDKPLDLGGKKQPELTKEQKLAEELALPSGKEILLSIAANRSKQEADSATDFLNQLKGGDIIEKSVNCVALAERVLFASKSGVVLLFKDEIDAKILNQQSTKNEFILGCCKLFRNPKYVVGFTANSINNLKQEIKQAMHAKIPELNMKPLRNILDENRSIEQLAYNLIYKDLDEKDKI